MERLTQRDALDPRRDVDGKNTERPVVRTLSCPDDAGFRPCFSPDGKRIAAGTGNDVRVWEVASGREVLRLTGHTRRVWVAVFSPDGQQLATSGWDGKVKVWDAGKGREMHTLEGHDETGVNHLAFSPDGKWLASAGHDKVARVWDVSTGKELAALRHPDSRIQHVAFSPDGKILATGGNEVILWDTEDWKAICTLAAPGSGLLGFTPDGKTLLTTEEWHRAGKARAFSRWDRATGRETASWPLPGKAGWLGGALSADGRTVCFVSTEGAPTEGKHRLATHDAETGKELLSPEQYANLVGAVAVRPDGKVLAGGAEDGAVRLWDLEAWAPGGPFPPCRVYEGLSGAVLALAFSPDGALLASAGKEGNVVVRDAGSGKKRWEAADPCAEGICPLAFSHDGKVLAVGQKDGVLARHDVRTGARLGSFAVHKGSVRAAAFSPDGRLLASAGEDGTVEVLSATDGSPIRSLQAPAACARVAFTPDSQTLVATTDPPDSRLCAWDLESGGQRVSQAAHAGPVGGLALNPGGGLAATGSHDGTVRVWDLATLGFSWGLDCRALGGKVGGVAFPPEGRYLIIGHGNGCLSVLRMP
jgi:WD40 repeat protein